MRINRTSLARISRRSFCERLGLGASAALLAPILEALVSEARGQTPTRKRAVLFLTCNGLSSWQSFTPLEFMRKGGGVQANGDPSHDIYYPNVDYAATGTEYTWPRAFAPLLPYRRRMLLVDGLANRGTAQHSAGYGALSCVETVGAADSHGAPGGMTFDQYLASAIGTKTPQRSVLFGVDMFAMTTQTNVFATDKGAPQPHFCSPRLLWKQLFGAMVPASATMMPAKGPDKRHLLLDAIRADVARAQRNLAGAERAKLDQYLKAITNLEQSEMAAKAVSCTAPGQWMREESYDASSVQNPRVPNEDKIEAMTEMAILALTCGLTNVVGVSIGCGNGHGQAPYGRIHKGTMFEGQGWLAPHLLGHDDGVMGMPDPTHVSGVKSRYGVCQDIMHAYHAKLLAHIADSLAAIKEGDKTAFDNSVLVYTNDNGEGHHSEKARWPVVVIGDAGGKLKSDGRFLRYAVPPVDRSKQPTPAASLADFWCSIATAMDAPTSTFGKGGREPVKGPLPEIMA
jgi:hypothetical protein